MSTPDVEPADALDAAPDEPPDPGRWITLGVCILAAFIVVLDNTVLNVAIPTILRDLNTTLPTLEWVITGYALTFASLLIIGGRLGDVYGHRRIFIIGCVLFGIGSLLASVSTSVGELIVGEAIIEGIGASLMLPTTLAILSGTFKGRERATAFAAWGATAGVAAAFGPVVGGFLTTNYSWRWSFRINVIVAPLAVLGAILFMTHEARPARRMRIDIPGAVLIAVGMFLLVFGLSEGGLYGWWQPLEGFSIGSADVWPSSWPVSVIPVCILVSFVILAGFVVLELHKQRTGQDPLFQFDQLKYRSYRYGLITVAVVSMGQLGLSFVLPVFLQDGKHLSAAENGWWLFPTGVFVIIGAQVAGRLTRRFGVTSVVRVGLGLYALGVLLVLRVIGLDITAWQLLPGLALYGAGIGFAGAQLTNVILSEIPAEDSGSASGANTTVRQVGAALGVSVIGSLLAVRTIDAATGKIQQSSLSAAAKAQALAGVRSMGAGYAPPPGTSHQEVAVLSRVFEEAVVTGTKFALTFAVVVIGLGAGLSLLIPSDSPRRARRERLVEELEPLEPVDPDPALLAGGD